MSSTRYAPKGAPLSQERYMSSPEYEELRGLSGNAVAAKAAFLAHPRKRSLLFFLQALSLLPGGLKKVVQDILTLFPERLGSPTMHRLGMKPGQVYNPKQVTAIRRELHLCETDFPLRGETFESYCLFAPTGTPESWPDRYSASVFLAKCRELAETDLERFLIELCVNPKVELPLPEEEDGDAQLVTEWEREQVTEEYPELGGSDFKAASLSYFRDIVPTLLKYQDRYAERERAEFVLTEVAELVFNQLDRALRRKKIVILEGREGIGKSEAAAAWCRMHYGEARFIDLKGSTNRTEFFRKLAKALGLGAGFMRKMTEMKSRVEEVLAQTKVLLVIDEAHHLLPAGERITTKPELIEWIYTITNSGVPVALFTTSQFLARIHQIEQRIIWNWGQVDRRSEYCRLPETTSRQDLEAIAHRKVPGACKATIKLLVGHAGAAHHQLTELADVILDAREIAGRDGRQQIEFEDVDRAIKEFRLPSEQAKAAARIAAAQRSKGSRRGSRKAQEVPVQSNCMEGAPGALDSILAGRRSNLPGEQPGDTTPELLPATRRLAGQAVEV